MLNFFFLIVFVIEAILKLSCMGMGYFKDGWNVFDFTILMVTGISTLI